MATPSTPEIESVPSRHDSSQRIVELLQRPQTYSDRSDHVDLVETHISWVFLTKRFAYKLKKPVAYDFLDFRTPELRYSACMEEVRLNRRLAQGVYLGVLPVTVDSRDQLHLGGKGTSVDWVVQMRRLPIHRRLDHCIQVDELSAFDVDSLANTLAQFYEAAPPLTVMTDVYRDEFERHVRANRAELLKTDHRMRTSTVKRVHGAQLGFLRMEGGLLEDRVRDGRIIDGHGDLRPEHIYFNSTPTIIDCIEFNAEFRRLDVGDELSFLEMELDYLDAGKVGDAIAESYYQASGDRPNASLLTFYKTYRACVRAKVHILRAAQLSPEQRTPMLEAAERYLSLADSYVRTSTWGQPALIVVRGLMGTGKSTLAAELAEALGTELLQTDVIRREMFGPGLTNAGYGRELYHATKKTEVYAEMFDRAADLVAQGTSVVLDGTFLTADQRNKSVLIACQSDAVPLIVSCECPDHVARERIAERIRTGDGPSEARPELHEQQKRDEEPDSLERQTVHVDTTESCQTMLNLILHRLATEYAGH